MSLQNRVSPFGDIVATDARGALMGNRGCLHNDQRQLGNRRWSTRSWVTCLLSFRDRRRELMRPGYYTELFFLDEATALAAGHRPCAECRRSDYQAFKTFWASGQGIPQNGLTAAGIDRALHEDRVDETRRQRVFRTRAADLPDGAMVATGETAFLKWANSFRPWSFAGYGPPAVVGPEDEIAVLTPRSIVEALRAGYRPGVHSSALL